MSDNSWFGGNHGPEGVFQSLKGRMLEPHTQQPMQSSAHTAIRNAPAGLGQSWNSTIVVNTGITGGGGTMAAK